VNSVPAAPSTTSTDVLTRVIAGAVCLVLIDAAQLLIFYPGRTNTLWAWDLKPEVTAMTLGSVYAGGAYFFGRITFGAPWRSVAAGFPAVIMFVWMAAIATLFHLDRFHKDSLPFIAWAALYIVTPFLVPWLVGRNHNLFGAPDGPPLPRALQLTLGITGGALLAVGLLFLAAPQVAIDSWPWLLTPLTARVTGAVIGMYATVWLAIAVHNTWAGARIPLQSQVIGLAFLLLALVRGQDVIDWGALAVVIAAVAAAMLVTSAVLSRRAT
jgi:hypothetical protein